MRAIDTNIIVRFLTGDDAGQAAKARVVVHQGDLFVATSVLLESEWVLRSAYDFSARRIVQAFRAFAGLPGITLEAPSLVARALDWTDEGMDFADALHLGAAEGCTEFLSFDRKLARKAALLAEVEVVSP